MGVKVTYAITAKDEVEEMRELFGIFQEYKLGRLDSTGKTEVVVLLDDSVSESYDWSFLYEVATAIHTQPFAGNFADHKNTLNRLCHGDWIFQIDADEMPSDYLLEYLPELLDLNDEVDLIMVPRINIVVGLTDDHIAKWGWNVNELGHVNFPDYQSRLYRNTKTIRWEGKVHERIVGHAQFAAFPAEEEYCLIHVKDIDRQERQNMFYETI